MLATAALPGRTPHHGRTQTLRYRLLHTAARIIHGQRKRKIRIPATWPWAQQLADCLLAALALPPPAQC